MMIIQNGLTFSAFGLTLASNHPIPGLSPHEKTLPRADVFIDLQAHRGQIRTDPPWYQSPADVDGVILSVWQPETENSFQFHYSDGVDFLIDRSGSRVWASWTDPLTVEDVAAYLLGPIIGFVLRLRGTVCLHSSAVAIDNQAVAFVNPRGWGKSTLVAAFAMKGFPIIADDIVALMERDGRFLVQPAYPHLRLWPSSVRALFGSANALPRMTPHHPVWNKCYLDLNNSAYRFQADPLPLSTIYMGQRDERAPKLQIKKLSEPRGMLSLIANTYTAQFLPKDMQTRHFEVFGRLAHSVSIKTFSAPSGIEFLPAVCEAIKGDALNAHRSNQN